MNKSIKNSKKIFNTFFKRDLYGRFDDDTNIILSRGGWNDDYILFPELFRFCVNYSLEKHWVGYSDSLGHKNTIESVVKLANLQTITKKYTSENTALTLGNVLTMGVVFKQLKNKVAGSGVVTFSPYYPPIVRSVNFYFKKIDFVSSLKSESQILKEVEKKMSIKGNEILLLSNSIGVEGRSFSTFFLGRDSKNS